MVGSEKYYFDYNKRIEKVQEFAIIKIANLLVIKKENYEFKRRGASCTPLEI